MVVMMTTTVHAGAAAEVEKGEATVGAASIAHTVRNTEDSL